MERKQLEMELKTRKEEKEGLEEKFKEIKKNCKAMEVKLELRSKELAEVKRSSRYEQVIKLKEKLATRDQDLKDHTECSNTINLLKKKLRDTQTKLSNSNDDLKRCREKHKAAELVQSELKEECRRLGADVLMLQDRELMTRINGTRFSDNVRECIMCLVGEGEVPVSRCTEVIQIVCKSLFELQLTNKHLPSRSTAQNIADEAHVLAKHHVAEEILNSTGWDFHQDGTTRDHQKYIGTQVTVSSGKTLSVGFDIVAVEDTTTLLDMAVKILSELSEVYTSDDEVKSIYHAMLQNMTSVMSDRCAVMKSFKVVLNTYRKLELSVDSDLEYIYCNAHFLLGLSTNSEQVLINIEKEKGQLGRDQLPVFKHWGHTECATARFIRTASDCFGPRGDDKSGCREYWLAYCSERNITSRISSYRSNRFNNFYESAAALYHHRADIINFLDLHYEESSMNLKLRSVLADAKSPEIVALLRAVGLTSYVVTSPYWSLLQSSTEYVDFHKYVQEMHGHFAELAMDSTPLMGNSVKSVLAEFRVNVDAVLTSLLRTPSCHVELTKKALEALMEGFKLVTERQLADFLEDGRYGYNADNTTRQRMKHCKLTNLIGEYNFGDLDFSLFKRRHASIHHHSTVNMVKRNKTISTYYQKKSSKKKAELMALARKQAPQHRTKHQYEMRIVKEKLKAILAGKRQVLEAKIAKKEAKRRSILVEIKKNGGPCCCSEDIDKMLALCSTKTQRLNVLKSEISYLKEVCGVKDTSLKMGLELDEMVQKLKDVVTSFYDDGDTGGPPAKTNDHAYCFANQGDWVAVFYDGPKGPVYYIGQVLQVIDKRTATVTFLKKCGIHEDMYIFPSSMDIDENVASKYVVYSDFAVTSQNGRVWTVSNIEEVNQAFRNYVQLYCI